MSAFERLIPTGEQVPYFIYFNLPPEDIDVNIHPVKTEIKFENEQAIWQILLAAVKEAVGLFSGVTSLDFDVHGKPEIPVFDEKKQLNSPKVQYNPSYNPFKQNISRQSTKAEDWTVLYDGITTPPDKELSVFPEPVLPEPVLPVQVLSEPVLLLPELLQELLLFQRADLCRP